MFVVDENDRMYQIMLRDYKPEDRQIINAYFIKGFGMDRIFRAKKHLSQAVIKEVINDFSNRLKRTGMTKEAPCLSAIK